LTATDGACERLIARIASLLRQQLETVDAGRVQAPVKQRGRIGSIVANARFCSSRFAITVSPSRA
jgi:hypothetical protein